MTTGPVLAVVELSESFCHVWHDMAKEWNVAVVQLAPEEAAPEHAIAVIVAAGGEEDRALDLLPAMPRRTEVPLYLIGAEPSHRFAVEALRRGATDYFALPADIDLLRRTVAARAEACRSRVSTVDRAVDDPFATLHGQSDALEAVLDTARRVGAHGAVTILLQGETGTGKELLARALHESSPRSRGPFVAVNCAAIPATLMESELFGHERGAFTDAHVAKPGLFEEAHRGTLFLDEIGHLPLSLQGKLLRALDERRVRRVGANQSREVDVRIMAATHVTLADAVARGEFRQDLYYRLNVIVLTLPALRERGNDVELLAAHFAESLAQRYGLPTPALDDAARAALRGNAWPGNIRELRHAVERALLLSDPGSLDPRHLTATSVAGPRRANGAIPFPATLAEIQTAAVRAALAQYDGNKTAAARQLGISRARLQRLLERGDE